VEQKAQNHTPLRSYSPSLRRPIHRGTKRQNKSRPKQHKTQTKRPRPRPGLRNRTPLPTRRQLSWASRRRRYLVKNSPRGKKTRKKPPQHSHPSRRRRLHTLPKPNLRPSLRHNPPTKHAKPPQNHPRNKKNYQTSIRNHHNGTSKEVHSRKFRKPPKQSRTENFHTENKSATKRIYCPMPKIREKRLKESPRL